MLLSLFCGAAFLHVEVILILCLGFDKISGQGSKAVNRQTKIIMLVTSQLWGTAMIWN
jgi:hypothetical protein